MVRFMMLSSRPSGSVIVSCGKSMSTSAISLPARGKPCIGPEILPLHYNQSPVSLTLCDAWHAC